MGLNQWFRAVSFPKVIDKPPQSSTASQRDVIQWLIISSKRHRGPRCQAQTLKTPRSLSNLSRDRLHSIILLQRRWTKSVSSTVDQRHMVGA